MAVWSALYEDGQRQALVYCGLAGCARALGRSDYALAIVDEALLRFPDESLVLAEAAQAHERKGRWQESLAFWERIVHPPSTPVDWRHSYIHNLIVLGRFDDANSFLRAWTADHPDHGGFLALEAMIASGRHRHDEALALWGAYRLRFPEDAVGWDHYGRAHQAIQMVRVDATMPGSIQDEALASIETLDYSEHRALMMEFESLGATCEFGLVQRRFGAEPLGLLRFNLVGFGELLSAVANRFARMGEPDVTRITVSWSGEYYVTDRRWGLGMHTFVFEGQGDPDALHAKFCRRVTYLRDRFLEDRVEGRKTLVFTCPGLTMDELVLLRTALRSLGPAALLHVVFAREAGEGIAPGPPGTIVDLGDGLYIGHVSRAGKTPAAEWDIAYDEWVDVCSQVRQRLAAMPVRRRQDEVTG